MEWTTVVSSGPADSSPLEALRISPSPRCGSGTDAGRSHSGDDGVEGIRRSRESMESWLIVRRRLKYLSRWRGLMGGVWVGRLKESGRGVGLGVRGGVRKRTLCVARTPAGRRIPSWRAMPSFLERCLAMVESNTGSEEEEESRGGVCARREEDGGGGAVDDTWGEGGGPATMPGAGAGGSLEGQGAAEERASTAPDP